MNDHFAHPETLPNGVFVHKKIVFLCDSEDQELPWLASINICNWHYCQGGETKEKSVENLYLYMERVKADFQDIIRIKTEQVNAVSEFLKCTN
jgi:hypothetical protein